MRCRHITIWKPFSMNISRRFVKSVGLTVLALLVAAIGVWGTLLLEYAGPHSDLLRTALVVGFALAAVATLIALFVRRWRWPAIGAYVILCGGLAVLWSSLEPTNDRNWQTDLAVLAHATINGDKVTVFNVRNFDYRSETDYTPAYYPGFPGWIAPAGLKAAETLTKLPIPYFHPSGPSEFGYLIQRKGLI